MIEITLKVLAVLGILAACFAIPLLMVVIWEALIRLIKCLFTKTKEPPLWSPETMELLKKADRVKEELRVLIELYKKDNDNDNGNDR